MAVLVSLESIPALAIVVLEGSAALAVLMSAGLAGGWMVRWLGFKQAPWAERLILGAGLGIGLLPIMVLGLSLLGLFTRTAAFLLVGGLALAGLTRLFLDVYDMGLIKPSRNPAGATLPKTYQTAASPEAPASMNWLWLLVCPFIAIMLLAASLPPGVLWREEGFGYDVLEYHLAVPKIFYEQGRIAFLPDNVYSNFPLSSEMLSLLMMRLRGDPIEASFMAVTVNAGLAVLLMAAAWLAGRRFSPRAGVVAGVLAGTTPWVAYLAGIAYVEVGMLALGMCALAATLNSEKVSGRFSEKEAAGAPRKTIPTPFLAGLLAGLACGYKYTAVPLIAFPVSFALLAGGTSWPQRVRNLLLYGCAALIAFSPWMVRNTVNTGNPFYPLAYSVFGDRSGAWDDELHAAWRKVHGSAAAEHSAEPLLVRAWNLTGGDFRLGAAGFVLAAIGAVRRRDRWTAALLAMLAVQVVIWLTATHLFARFAVVMLLPALVLAGRALTDEHAKGDGQPAAGSSETPDKPNGITKTRKHGKRGLEAAGLVLVVAGSGYNLYRLAGLYYDHTRFGGTAIQAYGRTDWFLSGQWPGTRHWGFLNGLGTERGPGPSPRVMLVGEARTFYIRVPCEYATVFNRQPLAEALDRAPDPAAVLDWLRARGVTHLLVHWGEMARLADTYGFPPSLMNPGVYQMLVGAGLEEITRFSHGPEGSPPFATLFEVPRS